MICSTLKGLWSNAAIPQLLRSKMSRQPRCSPRVAAARQPRAILHNPCGIKTPKMPTFQGTGRSLNRWAIVERLRVEIFAAGTHTVLQYAGGRDSLSIGAAKPQDVFWYAAELLLCLRHPDSKAIAATRADFCTPIAKLSRPPVLGTQRPHPDPFPKGEGTDLHTHFCANFPEKRPSRLFARDRRFGGQFNLAHPG